jgi:hypothetical protein
MVTTLSDYVASKFHASHLITTAIHVMIVGFSIEIQAPCVQANVQHMLAIPSREARKRTNIRVPPGHNKCVTNNLLPHSRSRLPPLVIIPGTRVPVSGTWLGSPITIALLTSVSSWHCTIWILVLHRCRTWRRRHTVAGRYRRGPRCRTPR